jgi:hypothetical protein
LPNPILKHLRTWCQFLAPNYLTNMQQHSYLDKVIYAMGPYSLKN